MKASIKKTIYGGILILIFLLLSFFGCGEKSHETWLNKGVALYDLDQLDEALEAFNKAIEIKPDYTFAWYNLACLYSLKKEKYKALKYLRKAIENGYKNLSHIRKDKDLDFIRNEKEFKEIIDKL